MCAFFPLTLHLSLYLANSHSLFSFQSLDASVPLPKMCSQKSANSCFVRFEMHPRELRIGQMNSRIFNSHAHTHTQANNTNSKYDCIGQIAAYSTHQHAYSKLDAILRVLSQNHQIHFRLRVFVLVFVYAVFMFTFHFNRLCVFDS